MASIVAISILAAACSSSTATPDTRASVFAPKPARATASPPDATTVVREPWTRGQLLIDYSLVGPGQGWVWAQRGIYQTLDDGQSWLDATRGPGAPRGVNMLNVVGMGAFDVDHAFLAVIAPGLDSSSIDLWRTADGGRTWADVALPPFRLATGASCAADPQCVAPLGNPVARFDVVDANVAFLQLGWAVLPPPATGEKAMQYKTTDGGRTWIRLHFTNPDDLYNADTPELHFASADSGLVVSNGKVFSTHTGWGSWTSRTITTYTGSDYWGELVASLVDPTHWYLAGDITPNGRLTYAVSADQGDTWTQATVSIPGVIGATGVDVAFLDQLNWIATVETMGESTIAFTTYKTGTAGADWSPTGALPLACIKARWHSTQRGWSMPGPASSQLYSTQDGGISWRSITG